MYDRKFGDSDKKQKAFFSTFYITLYNPNQLIVKIIIKFVKN